MALFPLVVIPAGAAVAVAASGGTPNQVPPPTNQTPGGAVKAGAGASPGATVGDLVSAGGNVPVGGTARDRLRRLAGRFPSGAAGSLATDDLTGLPAVYPSGAQGYIDSQLQEKLDTINSYGEAAYNNMSDAAKREGASAMNEALDLDPPLDGTESWDEIAETAGAAAGGTACAATGLGAAVTPLCAMAGAYLGAKLEDLISKNVDEIKGWFSSRWADIEGWVQGIGQDVGDAAQAAIDYVGGWF